MEFREMRNAASKTCMHCTGDSAMKTSYLLRQCPWMNADERRVARYTARRAEQAMAAGGNPLNPAHACAIFTLCTAFALYQRVQARFAEALASGGDFEVLGTALEQTQAAFLRAQEQVDKLTARANGIALPEPATDPKEAVARKTAADVIIAQEKEKAPASTALATRPKTYTTICGDMKRAKAESAADAQAIG